MDSTLALALDERQFRALEALVAGASVRQAAEVAGVARETVSRWVHHDEDFRAALATARVEHWQRAQDHLRSLLPKAILVLSRAMDSKSATTRLRAASALLRHVGIGEGGLRPPAPPPARLTAHPDEAAAELEAYLEEVGAMAGR